MGIMNRMRENTAVVLWILVISFGGIWVLQDAGVFEAQSSARLDNVATVDGEPISYQSYARALEAQRQQYQAQTGESMPPQLYDIYKDQIFDALVDDILREREMERLAIEVSDTEVINLILGDSPDPLIVQQFGDGNGGVDRDLIRSLIDNPDMRNDWIQLESYLKRKRRVEKFNRLIEATVRVSEEEIRAEYVKRNRSADVQYVALRYSDVPDSLITLSERELGEFYNDTRDDYRQERSLNVQYIRYSKAASTRDTTVVVDELASLKDGFGATDTDSLFLVRNGSERGYVSTYFRVDELDSEIGTAIFADPVVGAVTDPIIVGDQVHLLKVAAVRDADDASLRARHILISASETASPEVRAAALAKANDLKDLIDSGEDFADLAREFSDDPGSGAKGGDLGWFGPGKMVASFEEAAYAASIGDLVGPVESRFGYHLIEVQQRTDKELMIADFVLRIRPSIDTIRDAEDAASDLGYFAQESGDFSAEVAKYEHLSMETVLVESNMDVIPGLGASNDVKQFLAVAREGAISDVIELNDDFVVLHVAAIIDAGFREFEDVRAELEPKARLAKKREMQAEALRAALTPGIELDELAESVGSIRRVANSVDFNNTIVPTLGRDPKFVGTALGLVEGQISDVIEGPTAAYVMRVSHQSRPDLEMLNSVIRGNLEREIGNRKRQAISGQWLAELRESADIADFRYRF